MFYSVVIPGILLAGPVRETLVGTLSGGQAGEPGRLSHTRRRESVHTSMTAEKSRDAQRIDASSSNDAGALSQLYEQFRRPIHSYIYRLLGNVEDADDVTQEVFVRACIAWDGLYDRNNLSAWLYRIATNLCVDLLRRRKRISRWPFTYRSSDDERFENGTGDHSLPLLPDSGGIPEIAEREHIRLALANMPEEYAVALVLSAAQGVPYQEIALIVGISPNAAATRISRAKRMFAEQYRRLSKEGVEKQENRR